MEQRNMKKLMVLKIIAFKSGTTNSYNAEQDTCRRQSMCYETPLRFNISLKEIFSKSGSLRVMKKDDESALMQISQELGTFNFFTVKGFSETVFFRDLPNQVFRSLYFPK